MSYPRVNLLKKSEQRYQGAVSRRFMVASVVLTPLLVVALLSSVKLIQYGSIKSNLNSSREIWRVLEPRLAVANEQQHGLKINRQAIELFDGWQESKIPMEELMMDVQQVIPSNVQLTRLSIRADSNVSLYQSVEELIVSHRLVLQGTSQGDDAESSVIKLRRELLSGAQLSRFFESVNLTSMRKRRGLDGENIREFSLEGLSGNTGGEQ